MQLLACRRSGPGTSRRRWRRRRRCGWRPAAGRGRRWTSTLRTRPRKWVHDARVDGQRDALAGGGAAEQAPHLDVAHDRRAPRRGPARARPSGRRSAGGSPASTSRSTGPGWCTSSAPATAAARRRAGGCAARSARETGFRPNRRSARRRTRPGPGRHARHLHDRVVRVRISTPRRMTVPTSSIVATQPAEGDLSAGQVNAGHRTP